MARTPYVAREHEFEPQHGLPEELPAGEAILWQGSPDWRRLARSAFHVDLVAGWFAVLLAWRAATIVADGGGAAQLVQAATWMLPLAGIGIGLVLLLAWLSARTTVYTLTDRRIVMRIGIVLTIAFNLPLKRIEGASLHALGKGTGDIALLLEDETRIAWLQLWPHARPWRMSRPQPMLRAVPQAQAVAQQLTQAWSRANGTTAGPAGTVSAAAVGEPRLAAR
jgi:hypothetical protein